MSNVVIPAKVWRNVEHTLLALERRLDVVLKNYKPSTWMDEDEMMRVTGYSKRTLIEKRKEGLFEWRKQPGNKGYEYHRSSVEEFKNKFSTIHN